MRHAGFSLLELIVVLGLLATLLGAALPPALRWRDALAVRAARDEVVSALAWTRVAAVARGGARLVIEPSSGRVRTETAGAARIHVDLARRYGVSLEGERATIEIGYDALGIGRGANRTLILRRGAARASVIVSLYGRVRAW
ncbi:MAG TPA: prepilin-type N-terminal cleavage/methylation domain-containing protein [Longimicrobiales bacterium]|nr:prepilin-type N-terminal cleavage/methylation domain-containing protein [Longimicrobiales bacterium]